ncbi:MAG: type 4a pilus biogenesis protein PilO [Phycisphaeraceae bacterium]
MPIHLVASVICVALLLVGWMFGYAPLMSQNHEATTLVEQADQAELEASRAKQTLDRVAEKMASVQAELDAQPVDLQSASQINPLLAQLAKWSELQGLSLTRTNAGRPVALAYYDYVPIQVAGEGEYADLLHFLKRVNSDRGDLGVVSFQVVRMPSSNGVTFELELAWYVHGDEIEDAVEATATVPTP